MKISDKSSHNHWQHLKGRIEGDFQNENLWKEAYQLFLDRIKSRYLNQADILKEYAKRTGEGFTIMAIYCSLIEFFETTYQGLNFNSDNNRGAFEYGNGKSKELFVSFLTTRKPFKLDETTANDFYYKVRCALLHQAKTDGNWKIRIDIQGSDFITKSGDEYFVNWIIFRKKIEQFLFIYERRLMIDDELKKAFVRKFDCICEIE